MSGAPYLAIPANLALGGVTTSKPHLYTDSDTGTESLWPARCVECPGVGIQTGQDVQRRSFVSCQEKQVWTAGILEEGGRLAEMTAG